MKTIQVTGSDVTLDLVWEVAQGSGRVKLELAPFAREKMQSSRSYIEGRMGKEAIYGVNTGFGAFSSVSISPVEIVQLQKNLIRSHSVGVGEPFTREETRAIMYLRANALATGRSGIRPLVVDKILEFSNADVLPVIPQQGSVGASGDLAPLSHLALALIGEGEVWKDGNRHCVARSAAHVTVQVFSVLVEHRRSRRRELSQNVHLSRSRRD